MLREKSVTEQIYCDSISIKFKLWQNYMCGLEMHLSQLKNYKEKGILTTKNQDSGHIWLGGNLSGTFRSFRALSICICIFFDLAAVTWWSLYNHLLNCTMMLNAFSFNVSFLFQSKTLKRHSVSLFTVAMVSEEE